MLVNGAVRPTAIIVDVGSKFASIFNLMIRYKREIINPRNIFPKSVMDWTPGLIDEWGERPL